MLDEPFENSEDEMPVFPLKDGHGTFRRVTKRPHSCHRTPSNLNADNHKHLDYPNEAEHAMKGNQIYILKYLHLGSKISVIFLFFLILRVSMLNLAFGLALRLDI